MKYQSTGRIASIFAAFIVMIFAVSIPVAQQQVSCPGAPVSRLIVGEQGRVGPSGANNMRSAAATSADLIGQIPADGAFIVLEGPVCADGFAWWRVDYAGTIGWTAEGRGEDYWLEPAGPLPPQAPTVTVYPTTTDTVPQAVACPGFLPSRLVVGEQARIVPGPANNLRADPTAGSQKLAEIPGGRTILVLEGPVCAGGLAWWRVDFSGIIGWTPEGSGDTYWIDPAGPVPTQAPTLTPTITPTPRPTNTPAPTSTPAPMMPVISRFENRDVLLRATLPDNLEVINAENIARLQPLAIIGTGQIAGFEVSPDGTYFVIQNNLGVWLNSFQNLSEMGSLLETADLSIRDVAFSPDGRYLAAGGTPLPGITTETLHIWDLQSGERLSFSFTDSVTAVAFSPDSRSLAVAVRSERPLRLIDLNTGTVNRLNVEFGTVKQISFSSDGALLAALSDRQIEVFNLATNRHQIMYEVQANLYRVIFNTSNNLLISLGSRDDSSWTSLLRIWNLVNGERIAVPDTFPNTVNYGGCLQNVANNELLFSSENKLYFWNLSGGQLSRSIEFDFIIAGCNLSPDGQLIVAFSRGTILSHDIANRTNTTLLTFTEQPGTLRAISHDGNLLAFSQNSHSVIEIYDAARREVVQSLEVGRYSAVAFSSDRTQLLVQSQTGVMAWDLETGESSITNEPFPAANQEDLKPLAASFYVRGATWQINNVLPIPNSPLLAVERDSILTVWDRNARLPLFSTTAWGRLHGFNTAGTLMITDLSQEVYVLWGIPQS